MTKPTADTEKTTLLITGAGGRMGRALIAAAAADPRAALKGAVDRPDSAVLGAPAFSLAGHEGGPKVSAAGSPLPTGVAVAIDFTTPAASLALLEAATEAGLALVIGTTGFSTQENDRFQQAATKIAIVKAGNMSLGVNLLVGLARQAAARLGPDFDVEISEAHHRHKVDAPSGTALMLGEAVAAGRGLAHDAAAVTGGRAGARVEGTIGYSVSRGGGIIGDHDVAFIGDAETLTLSHRALDRSLFARGALVAAHFAARARPGLYSMTDVLGL